MEGTLPRHYPYFCPERQSFSNCVQISEDTPNIILLYSSAGELQLICHYSMFAVVLLILLCIFYRGPWRVARDMVRHEGPLSLYKGLTSTWAREFPGYFFFFYGYEMTRNALTPAGGTKEDIG